MPSAQSLNNMQIPEHAVRFLCTKHPQVARKIQQAWKTWHSLEHLAHHRKSAMTKEHLLYWPSPCSPPSPLRAKVTQLKDRVILSESIAFALKAAPAENVQLHQNTSHIRAADAHYPHRNQLEKSIIVHIKSLFDFRGNVWVCQGNTLHLQLINQTTWGEGREW